MILQTFKILSQIYIQILFDALLTFPLCHL